MNNYTVLPVLCSMIFPFFKKIYLFGYARSYLWRMGFFLGGVGVQHVESLVVACGILVLDQGPIVSEISLCHY